MFMILLFSSSFCQFFQWYVGCICHAFDFAIEVRRASRELHIYFFRIYRPNDVEAKNEQHLNAVCVHVLEATGVSEKKKKTK